MNEHMQRVVSDVERAIHSICRGSTEYATRDAIASFLLTDSVARPYLSERSRQNGQPIEWIAGNTVDWFSAWMSRGEIATRDRYERKRIGRKWAYRPSADADAALHFMHSTREALRQLGIMVDPILISDTGTEEVVESPSRTEAAQTWMDDPVARQAIEQHAMAEASGYYVADGWHVVDVSTRQPFDLLCRRNGHELHVEVKGTTTEGRQILLTPNEVAHARTHYPNVALVVVAQIDVSPGSDGMPVARGGTTKVYEPWAIDAGGLTALSYTWTAP